MSLKIGTETVGGLKIGTEVVGGMKIGTELIYRAGPAPSHTYTITAGVRGGFVGYWDNNIGSITDETRTLADGTSTEIRQTMAQSGSGTLRFLYRRPGLTISTFPATIVTTRAGTSILWTRPNSPQNFGQGTGADYTTTQTADIGTVFQNGVTINVSLFD